MRRRVYFNGKFYSANLNGVHRVADRLIREVDALVAADPALRREYDLRLLIPSRRSWTPELAAATIEEQPRGDSQAWEQFTAPRRARDGVLVNLCNLSPVLHPNKITLIHDAQFFLYPDSYPLRFQLGYRLLTPLMARTSRQVLTISEFSREMLAKFRVSPRDRMQVINNGADHILDQPADAAVLGRLGLAAGRYVLLFGSAMAYKNNPVVFSAFEDPRLEGLELVVVGPGRADLEAAGLHPPARTLFAGRVDDAGLRALYGSALCLAFPSLTEGFGLPPVEAMYCGCPTVAAPRGAVPEVCGGAALYANPHAVDPWIDAILRLAQDSATRDRLVEEGRRRAGQFTWRRAGRELWDVIARVAA